MTNRVALQAQMTIPEASVSDLVFNPNGQQFATFTSNSLSLWDITTGEAQRVGVEVWAVCIDYHPNGQIIAAGTQDGEIIMWETSTGQEIQRWSAHPSPEYPQTLTVSPLGDNPFDEGIGCLKFSRDGQLLVSGGLDSTIKLWEAATGHLQKTLIGHVGYVNSLAFSADAQMLISVSILDDGQISTENTRSDSHVAWNTDALIIWDTSSGLEKHRLNPQVGVYTLVPNPDKDLVVSGNDDGTISLWDIAAGELVAIYGKHSDTVHAVTFSLDGTLFASGGGRREHLINLWKTSDWSVLISDSTHDSTIVGLALSPDGKLLASATTDKIILWKIVGLP